VDSEATPEARSRPFGLRSSAYPYQGRTRCCFAVRRRDGTDPSSDGGLEHPRAGPHLTRALAACVTRRMKSEGVHIRCRRRFYSLPFQYATHYSSALDAFHRPAVGLFAAIWNLASSKTAWGSGCAFAVVIVTWDIRFPAPGREADSTISSNLSPTGLRCPVRARNRTHVSPSVDSETSQRVFLAGFAFGQSERRQNAMFREKTFSATGPWRVAARPRLRPAAPKACRQSRRSPQAAGSSSAAQRPSSARFRSLICSPG